MSRSICRRTLCCGMSVASLLWFCQSAILHAQSIRIGPRIASVELPGGSTEDFYIDRVGNIFTRSFLYGGPTAYDNVGRSLGSVAEGAWGMGGKGETQIVVVREDESQYGLESLQVGETGLESLNEVDVDFVARDVCGMRGHFFAVIGDSTDEQQLIRELDSSGQVVRSFGTREMPPAALAAVMGDEDYLINDMSYVVCDGTSDRLYFASRYFGIVRAFDVSLGRELWRSEIQDFVLSRIGATSSGGCCTYGSPVNPIEGAFHKILSISLDDAGGLLIGLEESRFSRTRRTGRVYELVLLDAATGNELERQPTDGAVVGVSEDGIFLYSAERDVIDVRSVVER